MSDHSTHDTEVGRIEAASVLLAKEANDLRETLEAATEWNERNRRQRFLRFTITLIVAVVIAVWMHDEHVAVCHISDQVEGVRQAVCNATFPLHGHPPTDANGFEDRLAGFLFYGGALVISLVLLLRDPRSSARYHVDMTLQDVLDGDEIHGEKRAAHWRRVERARAIEVVAGSLLSLFGLWLTFPTETFITPTFDAMANYLSEGVWGLIAMVTGATAAFVAWRDLLLWRRYAMIGVMLYYALISLGFAISNVASTGVPVYGGLAVASAYVVVQLNTVFIFPAHSKNS